MTKLHTKNQVSVRGFKSTKNYFQSFARGLILTCLGEIRMQFEWDEAKNIENIRNHRIDFVDWETLENMSDEDIDYSDIPPLTDR